MFGNKYKNLILDKGVFLIITFQLTEAQKQNLLVFLSRAQLTGQEALSFLEIIKIIKESENKIDKEDK